ncbi:flagellar biosynthetic protein FliO [Endozoicomonas sp. G2_1]|uniref:flagellar biosynthetic protein FliO n=1 Tax=Endozoicomonas sp. G2_1 TaxID=2821091 RepID=UPI001AD97596|nr:flagellar biosynthetic protein FliO [Endozoicomonas sp. G2_1]MBO9491739.1 flagellar biosynthetic protein FliO [Endozoicomonas sp. G2_1]
MNNKPKPVVPSFLLVWLLVFNFLGLSASSFAQEGELGTEQQQITQGQELPKPEPELESELVQEKAIEQKATVKQTSDIQADKVSTSTTSKGETVRVGQHTASNNLDAMSMILSLFMVLALIIVAALLLKRFQLIRPQSAQLKLVTSLHLSAKEKLVVVQVGEQQLLLGISGQQINLLHKLEQALPDEKMATAELGQNLSQVIGKYLNKGHSR